MGMVKVYLDDGTVVGAGQRTRKCSGSQTRIVMLANKAILSSD